MSELGRYERMSEEQREKHKARARAQYWAYRDDPEYIAKGRIRALRYSEKKRFGQARKNILDDKCAICSTDKKVLVIHHINGQGSNTDEPDNRLKNLITLCKTCHYHIHFTPHKFKDITPLIKKLLLVLDGHKII